MRWYSSWLHIILHLHSESIVPGPNMVASHYYYVVLQMMHAKYYE